MKTPVIAAAAVLTALGDLEETWQGLLAGHSALRPGPLPAPLDRYPIGLVPGLSEGLGSAARQAELYRRLLGMLPELPAETGVLLSTTKGAVDEIVSGGAPPWLGQPWGLVRELANDLGLHGPLATVSGACASGTIALIQAAQTIRNPGGPDTILVVGIDLLSVFVTSGFARLQALTQASCRPFDRQRDGLALGEGAGALLVCDAAEAKRRGWPVLAALDGWGVSADAGHITAPCREASGLKRALALCTGNGQKPVGAVNAHGTGTKFNDAMEIRAFCDSLPPDTPYHSVKGAIGHTLGAAGVIEAAIAVKSLAAGVIPPTIGLVEPEAENAVISGLSPLPLSFPAIVSCNSGFGGINAAVRLVSVAA